MTKRRLFVNRRGRSKLTLPFALLIIAQLACGGLFGGGEQGGGGAEGGVSQDAPPAPHFKAGFNLFSPEQDVEVGRQSAEQMAREMPLLRDEQIVGYVRGLGARLAEKAPGHKFPYQFHVVAAREINAFALPGGYIFVNAGTIAAAKNEGELAGVISHEIMHVALRHGTNQMSKAYLAKAGIGILGALTGGRDNPDLAQVVESVGGAGANMLFLKFGRTAERQSDLEGARIMAEAGYDPRDMANFFKTLAAEGGQRVPEFLSDHPDPGNRFASITELLPSLPVSRNPVRTSAEFQRAKSRLTGERMAAEAEPTRKGPSNPDDNEAGTRPQGPSASTSEYTARDRSFSFQYPQNWDGLSTGDGDANLIFAPKGAYGQREGAIYATHGIFVGALDAGGQRDLESATRAFLQQQLEANPDFRVQRAPQAVQFAGRQGFATVVAGPSPVTGVVEVDVVYTTVTSDGRLFYLITMAPEDEF
ncbi:MAG TPA: M48 family metallopeptidase, partial [Pyrinomonadaceae bacterium]|nr:M48 family metallopeptidase [Pyrinomonadaceae bacterium]